MAVLLGLFIAIHTPAQADCVRMQPLAVMHDAYRALLSENAPHTKAVAANKLMEFVPIYPARTFESAFANMDLDIETARLEKVLVDALFLGRDALTGGLIQLSIPGFHLRNADWLSGTIARTGCFRDQSAAQSDTPIDQFGVASNTSAHSNTPAAATTDKSSYKKPQKGALTGALLGIVAIFIASLIYRSHPFRVKRAQRLPRHAVAFTASASFEDSTSPIIVLDISAGGAKIECDHPPIAKEILTLHLPCGSVPATIVWATAFYAGVMFDKHLSEADLQAVLEDEKVTTRSRLSNVF